MKIQRIKHDKMKYTIFLFMCWLLSNTYGQTVSQKSKDNIDLASQATLQREGVECELPVATGSCDQNITRYYYDQAQGQCRSFEYTGCDGNLNNFQHFDECNFRCVCSRPRDLGNGDLRVTRFFYNVNKKECQTFGYRGSGGNANNFRSVDACQSTCDPIRNRCKDRPNYGRSCNNSTAETVYFYDINCDCCRSFVYLGCGGNHNKFSSSEKCLKKCSGSSGTPKPPSDNRPDLCYFQPVYGDCSGQRDRYFYDNAEGRCLPFLYSGCGGNANNFLTVNQCKRVCKTKQNKPGDNKESLDVATPNTTTTTTTASTKSPLPVICEPGPDRGPCVFNLNRFYFDKRDSSCKPFVWSGCGGNTNRFVSLQQCLGTCLRF